MTPITLRSDGIIEYRQRQLTDAPTVYLGYPVSLGPDYTLRCFFRLLSANPSLAGLNPFLPSFVDQYRQCRESGCRVDGVGSLALNRTVEMIGFPGTPQINLFVTLCGVAAGEPVDIRPFWLDLLLDVPLVLGKLKHVVFGDNIETFEFETVFNLFEVIDGIAWQLSFHNMPAECRIAPSAT